MYKYTLELEQMNWAQIRNNFRGLAIRIIKPACFSLITYGNAKH
jgi:hypothetical protein